MRKEGIAISAFVIMPNHIHLVAFVNETTQSSLNNSIATSKRFWAYEIVKRLKEANKKGLIKRLKDGVRDSEKRKGKKHQVFRLSFDAKICDTIEMLEQKIDYIHANPVSGRWSLAKTYVDYPHSSASYYENGNNKPDFLIDYREV